MILSREPLIYINYLYIKQQSLSPVAPLMFCQNIFIKLYADLLFTYIEAAPFLFELFAPILVYSKKCVCK